MKIGIAQVTGAPAGEAEIADWVTQAMDALPEADLIMLPELALCGYNDPDRVRRLALEKNGPALNRLAALAAGKRQALAFGYAERAGDRLYNALQVIDQRGQVRADYRKVHLWSGYETALFAPGRRFSGFELDGLRFGAVICYDLDFPESVRVQAVKGLDCLLCLSATTTGYDVVPQHVVPVRAYENGCFVAFANRGDASGDAPCVGQSRIVGPGGNIIAALPGNGAAVLSGEINPAVLEEWRRHHPYLAQRRPDLY